MGKKFFIFGIGILFGISSTILVKGKIQSEESLKALEMRSNELDLREKKIQVKLNKLDALQNEVEQLRTLTEVQETELKIYRKKPYSKNKPKLIEKSIFKEKE